MDYHRRLALLRQQLCDAPGEVFELFHELDALEVLRAHVPDNRRWLLDRLETALRRIDSLHDEISDAETDCELEEIERAMDAGDPPEVVT